MVSVRTLRPRVRTGARALVLPLLAAIVLGPLGGSGAAAATADRPFAATSPFNTAIAAAPAVDRGSAAMVARLARDPLGAHAHLVAYGVPIARVDAATPVLRTTCAMAPAWGACPFASTGLPVPAGLAPNTGEDGVLVTVDERTRRSHETWQYTRTSATAARVSWGAVTSLDGSGWGGGATGAGASRLGGVVRVAEIRAGVIPHALVVAVDSACAGVVRAPATKTDGDSTRTDCVPEGARLQLDPRIDVAALPGLTRADRAVARALQVYGAYVIDRGGSPLSVTFERAPDAGPGEIGAAYRAAGLRWDYDQLSGVPWSRLRVLA